MSEISYKVKRSDDPEKVRINRVSAPGGIKLEFTDARDEFTVKESELAAALHYGNMVLVGPATSSVKKIVVTKKTK